MHNSVYNQKLIRVLAPQVAGTGDTIPTAAVRTRGFSGIEFIVGFGAITATAVTKVKLQGSDDNATWSDIEGSSVTVADTEDGTVVRLEVYKPRTQYVRAAIVRATANAVVDLAVALCNLPGQAPVTQDATVSHALVLNNPNAGVA